MLDAVLVCLISICVVVRVIVACAVGLMVVVVLSC